MLAGGELLQVQNLSLEGNMFRREGDYRVVSFDGQRVLLRHRLGMDYRPRLLERPGQSTRARDLEAQFGKKHKTGARRANRR